MTAPPFKPGLVDYWQAAKLLGRPEPTLRRWIHEGRLTRYGSARRILVDLAELDPVFKRQVRVPPRRSRPVT